MELRFSTARDHILPGMHPLMIERPQPMVRTFIITSPITQRVQVRRHWNEESGRTEPCRCEPPCGTMREDYFTGALMLKHTDPDGTRHWEQVVLHLTETTVRSIYAVIQMRGDKGDLQHLAIQLKRVGNANGRVTVTSWVRMPAKDRPGIDVAGVILKRLHIATNMFSEKIDHDTDAPEPTEQTETPARTREEKPRVPKGTRG